MASVELVPWDGELPGMAEGLADIPKNVRGVLILADSKTAIATVSKAGRTGKARSRHFKKVGRDRGAGRGRRVVRVGWVKVTTAIPGNEAAEGVPLDDHEKWMSGGGYKTVDKTEEERIYRGRGSGSGREERKRSLRGRWGGEARQ